MWSGERKKEERVLFELAFVLVRAAVTRKWRSIARGGLLGARNAVEEATRGSGGDRTRLGPAGGGQIRDLDQQRAALSRAVRHAPKQCEGTALHGERRAPSLSRPVRASAGGWRLVEAPGLRCRVSRPRFAGLIEVRPRTASLKPRTRLRSWSSSGIAHYREGTVQRTKRAPNPGATRGSEPRRRARGAWQRHSAPGR